MMTDCTHHWIIETTQGQVAHGYCKLCSKERTFENQRQVFTHQEQQAQLIAINRDQKLSRDKKFEGVIY